MALIEDTKTEHDLRYPCYVPTMREPVHLKIEDIAEQFRLIVFDADGTLRRCTVDGQPCPNDSGQWEVITQMRGFVSHVSDLKSSMEYAIASNQGGVQLGYLTRETAEQLLSELAYAVFPNPPYVDIRYCCTFSGFDERRKPNPGMIIESCKHFHILPSSALVIGDQETDLQAARAARCRFIYAQSIIDTQENPR